MARNLHSFLTFLVCIALDWVWLAGLAGELLLYRAADWFQPLDLIFYLLFTAGLLIFSTYPALFARDRNIALYYGAVFGLAVFGLYGLVNGALHVFWPTTLIIVDTAWGTFAGAVCGLLSFELGRWLGLSGSATKDVALDRGMFLE